MPPEVRTALVELYRDFVQRSREMESELDRTLEGTHFADYPRERAFVSSLRQSLGELATVASIAADGNGSFSAGHV